VCFGIFRRQAVRPALGRGGTARAHVSAEYPWLGALLPAGRPAAGSLQPFLALLAEKRLLLEREVPALDRATREGLDRLVASACGVARLAADVEAVLAAARRSAEADRERCLGGELAWVCAADDAYGALLGRLVRLHAAFNRLLGRAIVLGLPLDAADTALLEGCLDELAAGLEAGRQARVDLGRLA
jgi:hypothetical protein